jgi:hypothetical protein
MLIDPYGRAVQTPDVKPMTRSQIQRFEEFEGLLREMGWQIVCTKCARIFGMGKDGVQSHNDPGSDTLEVRCGCSRYVFSPSASKGPA